MGRHASMELRSDHTIVLSAVEQDGSALRYAALDLRRDRGIVFAAVQRDGSALRFASLDLRADPEIILAAAEEDALSLQYAVRDFNPNSLKCGSLPAKRRRRERMSWNSASLRWLVCDDSMKCTAD